MCFRGLLIGVSVEEAERTFVEKEKKKHVSAKIQLLESRRGMG